ncbi:hypothetical protein G7046_g2944 [Stylonectria norvegica]|nr:hypothetical protein G7046_g2944 [Stylonectria norvegica]
MTHKVIAVVGTTGKQGGSVADAFLASGNWDLRGLISGSKQQAFAGVNAIPGMTYIWPPLATPGFSTVAEQKGIMLNQVAYDLDVQSGKKLGFAASYVGPSLLRNIISVRSGTKELSQGKHI